MKKLLVVGVIVLFLGVSVIPSTGTTDVKQSTMPTAKGDTLYVGGNGTGNYTKIQDAIDDANNGDTVYVYDDSSPYYEHVKVNKSINLVGENRDTTIIDGNESGNVIEISANHVNILCFTIQKSGSHGIYISSNYNTIIGNIVTSNNRGGIRLDLCGNNTITGNNVSNNDYGIGLYISDNNTITGNNASNNYDGITLSSGCKYNIITGNNVSNNYYGIKIVIVGHHNIVTSNSISNNDYGIWLESSYDNTIKCNNIQNNDVVGLMLSIGNKNIIEENNFIGNKRHVLFGYQWRNTWNENYWDNWIGLKINLPIFQKLPKLIVGFIVINFDWHPASEPYDI